MFCRQSRSSFVPVKVVFLVQLVIILCVPREAAVLFQTFPFSVIFIQGTIYLLNNYILFLKQDSLHAVHVDYT